MIKRIRLVFALILLIFSAAVFAADSTAIPSPVLTSTTQLTKTTMRIMHLQPMVYPWSQGGYLCSSQGHVAGNVSKFTLMNVPAGFPSGNWGLFVYYCDEPIWPTDSYFLTYYKIYPWVYAVAGDPYCGAGEVCSWLNTKPPVIQFKAGSVFPMYVTGAPAGQNEIWPNGNFQSIFFINRWYSYQAQLWVGNTQPYADTSTFYLPGALPPSNAPHWPPQAADYYPPGWYASVGGYPYLSLSITTQGTTVDQGNNARTLYCSSGYYLINFDTLGKTCYANCDGTAAYASGTWYNTSTSTVVCTDTSLPAYSTSTPY